MTFMSETHLPTAVSALAHFVGPQTPLIATHPLNLSFSASPVSRLHTRNPFIKQLSEASALAVRALSPAAIPLPTPTPDEWQTLQDA